MADEAATPGNGKMSKVRHRVAKVENDIVDDGSGRQSKAELKVLEELKAATRGLRDAELAVQAAQGRYKEALGAFNRIVAPVPGQ